MDHPARLKPLPHDLHDEFKPGFEASRARLGFMPNSMLILQRRPGILRAFRALTQAVAAEDSALSPEMRALVTFAACTVSKVPYVHAHAAHSLVHTGQEKKLAAFADYAKSPLFSPKERVTIEFARAAASLPNAVSDELLGRMREHWNEEGIVDVTALVALYGFFDRWNGSMSTPLENEPREVAEQHIAGWTPGRH